NPGNPGCCRLTQMKHTQLIFGGGAKPHHKNQSKRELLCDNRLTFAPVGMQPFGAFLLVHVASKISAFGGGWQPGI
ncbi:MAG: hypothetical protein JW892_08505, partial [Anaerolineae bacterium]|nr:hypothetical protein [Anaerolineae bacterium]